MKSTPWAMRERLLTERAAMLVEAWHCQHTAECAARVIECLQNELCKARERNAQFERALKSYQRRIEIDAKSLAIKEKLLKQRGS